MQYSLSFPTGMVNYIFEPAASALKGQLERRSCVLITDSHLATLYPSFFEGYKTIVLPPGEGNKNWASIPIIAEQLIQHKAHRNTQLVGIGGGVITDITGFVASIYMRGIPFGYIPTSLLGMADAAVGGKNGVNLGLHKNILGAIQQPGFIIYDTRFLETLPAEEWSNGFAEIIKYACLFDAALFDELNMHDIHFYQKDEAALDHLIARCVAWKNKTVLADEKESNTRKLLNFGHTAGHALETLYSLPHGHAVAIGMIIACMVSEQVTRLDTEVKKRLISLLEKYQLPVSCQIDIDSVMNILEMDKKRKESNIDYIILEQIGKGAIKSLSFENIQKALVSFAHAGNH